MIALRPPRIDAVPHRRWCHTEFVRNRSKRHTSFAHGGNSSRVCVADPRSMMGLSPDASTPTSRALSARIFLNADPLKIVGRVVETIKVQVIDRRVGRPAIHEGSGNNPVDVQAHSNAKVLILDPQVAVRVHLGCEQCAGDIHEAAGAIGNLTVYRLDSARPRSPQKRMIRDRKPFFFHRKDNGRPAPLRQSNNLSSPWWGSFAGKAAA
jgi:hypothetical protein